MVAGMDSRSPHDGEQYRHEPGTDCRRLAFGIQAFWGVKHPNGPNLMDAALPCRRLEGPKRRYNTDTWVSFMPVNGFEWFCGIAALLALLLIQTVLVCFFPLSLSLSLLVLIAHLHGWKLDPAAIPF